VPQLAEAIGVGHGMWVEDETRSGRNRPG